jgi:hypothetical protein
MSRMMLTDSKIITFFGHQWPLIAIPLVLWSTARVIRKVLEAMKSPLPGPKLAKYTAWWMRMKSVVGEYSVFPYSFASSCGCTDLF